MASPSRVLDSTIRLVAAALCLAVAAIHIQDQGGFPGTKTPHYVGVGYYLLELGGAVCALLLAAGIGLTTNGTEWLITAGIGLGPLVGYVLSRGPGLPGYPDDKGNWTEPLGLASIAVEGALLLLVLLAVARRRSARSERAATARIAGRAAANSFAEQ